MTSAQLVTYLIQHGANAYETDVRGASLFHWAAGCGNLDALKALVVCCNTCNVISSNSNSTLSTPGTSAALLWKASRDDAIPLHWAAAGAGPKTSQEMPAQFCFILGLEENRRRRWEATGCVAESAGELSEASSMET